MTSLTRVASIIRPEHFYDPVHAPILKRAARIAKNCVWPALSRSRHFSRTTEAFKNWAAPPTSPVSQVPRFHAFAARDYAQMIYDFAIRRELIGLGQDIAAKAGRVEIDSEPTEQIVQAEQKLYALAEQGQAERGFQSFLSAVTEAVNTANAAYQRDGGLSGVSTGLIDLDKKLGGLHRSDLLILAGRPSMGKTSLATNIAFNVAKAYRKGALQDGTEGAVNGGVVGFYSLEMSAEQLAARILVRSLGNPVPTDPVRRYDRG